MIKTILSGHTSPETAYVIEDYPYGFRLRCKMRCWLETSPTKGTRFVTQTTNPKRGNIWNKQKESTYAKLSGAMYLDENGHVQWQGLSEYAELDKCNEFLNTFGESATNYAGLVAWVRRKVIFEEEMNKFTPRPEYGTALFRAAYLASVARYQKEGI